MSKITFVLVLVALFALTAARVDISQRPDQVQVVDGAQQVDVVDNAPDAVHVVDGQGPQPRDGSRR